MAALEEQGYLTHPHTSAGRIPTDAGYRHYVDTLPAPARLKDAQRRQIASHFAEVILDLEEVLKGSVHLLCRGSRSTRVSRSHPAHPTSTWCGSR